MAYIYKITNQLNGKIYIGKTLEDIHTRWREHLHDSKKRSEEKRPLYDAINKYGSENFSIEEVEECSPEVLNDREVYWIEQYGSFKNGYNATRGGEGKQYADYDLIVSLFKQGKNNKEIVKITGYDTATVTKALSNNNISREERRKRGFEAYSRPVAKLDKDTEEILEVFSSIADAERKYPSTKNHITPVCKGKRKTTGGFKWKYLTGD